MKFYSAMLLMTCVFSVTAFRPALIPAVVEGKIIDAVTRRPVADAYVHITIGEEEAITGKDGIFTLKTWRALPAKCTVEHKDFAQKVVEIKQAGSITVLLQKKQ